MDTVSIASQDLVFQTWTPQDTSVPKDRWQASVEHRLALMSREAHHIEFDNKSRFVFLSDCHRGNGGRTDDFAPNKALYLHALEQYERQGFTYVEVGDGDELWQNRSFAHVHRAHSRIFDLLHRFDRRGHLYLLLGNHDIQHRDTRHMTKDDIPVRECLRLSHAKSGQSILVFHGHQMDPQNDRFASVSRFTVRNIWRTMLLLGLAKSIAWSDDLSQRHRLERLMMDRVRIAKTRIEQRMVGWAHKKQQMIICGHTHHPVSAQVGATPYFNTGSCVEPGQITGLEIENGDISQIRWTTRLGSAGRERLGPPKPLAQFAGC